ncbi:hypothetical protein GENT5_14240 [Flavobacterium ammoniigenes]|uniref:Uncharacterized protein n=1 Tax=Flavobacterium ammoniigenes TaxID=1751095 RepID=A0ABN6L416_9FLAO|nr:hypothetical protein GENT5_14240 [Flavobacterium ammoniigenes]
MLSIIFIFYKMNKIPYFALHVPQKYFAILTLIYNIGIMLLSPALLILIRHFVIKKSISKNDSI